VDCTDRADTVYEESAPYLANEFRSRAIASGMIAMGGVIASLSVAVKRGDSG
jgi:hypothetical protein